MLARSSWTLSSPSPITAAAPRNVLSAETTLLSNSIVLASACWMASRSLGSTTTCPDLEGEPRDPFAAPRSEAGEWMPPPRRSSALVDYLKDAQQLKFRR